MLLNEKNIVFRQIITDDLPKIASMMNSIYRVQRPLDFCRWQCFENVDPSKLFGAFCEGDPISTFGIHKRRLTNGLLCGQVGWTNTVSEWRGNKLFKLLGELTIESFQNLDVLLGLSNSVAIHPYERHLNFKVIGKISKMVLNNKKSFPEPEVGYEEITRETFFDYPVQNKNNKVGFQVSKEYFYWRYALHPIYSYSLVRLDTGEFAVIKIFTDPISHIRFGDIVDFECSFVDQDNLHKLLVGAIYYLLKNGAEKICTWPTDTLLKETLEDLGFEETPNATYCVMKVLNPSCNYLYDFSQWYFNLADTTNY